MFQLYLWELQYIQDFIKDNIHAGWTQFQNSPSNICLSANHKACIGGHVLN